MLFADYRTEIYSSDGNTLIGTTNALDKYTEYVYNISTNVLEAVQYPEDLFDNRTEYGYDSMCRLAMATAYVDTGYSLYVTYGYTNDLLTRITTNSTTYNFTYGDFAQRSSVQIGNRTLASYTYTDDQNRYLDKLTYGNGDYVEYEYDKLGRVVKETFEDGSTMYRRYRVQYEDENIASPEAELVDRIMNSPENILQRDQTGSGTVLIQYDGNINGRFLHFHQKFCGALVFIGIVRFS